MLPTSSTTVAQQTGITSAYTYDRTGRLTASAHSATPAQALPSGWSLSDIIGPNSMGYAYDANGNRTQAFYSITTGGGTTTVRRDVKASAGTNRVTGYTQTDTLPGSTTGQVSTVAFTLDTGGSITRMGDTYLHYSPQGRIARTSLNSNAQIAQAVDYSYTSASQRVFKRDARLSTTTPATEHTVYADDDIGSTVLGVYGNRRSTNSAAPTGEMDSTEVIYLPTPGGPMPIAAQINGRAYAIHTDHLNTPRRLTNAQGQVAWQWLVTGFGEVQPTLGTKGYALSGIDNSRVYSEAVTFNLRYPGQWDAETKLNYNLNRYYDPQTGRYIQSDPIGLEGGWNRFGYVGGNPLFVRRSRGVEVRKACRSWRQSIQPQAVE
ncbi:MAG: RHS repeat-associated core domain-containing protein [Acidovorax sp.]|uniref:RHS repeat-associated core domain-containing protein n=1 Tax=Acidovorax sp. TaxID=1872122 RepID=UPI000A4D988E|nr:RHS repeat-associated core domain-containing protein [Acidovorax sp.]MDH4427648.1 RHS repeat-associated core domain-containing protein [Acidovorax sp.]